MGKKKNIIEINGKRYDAHSGAAIDHVPVTVKPTASTKPITVQHHSSDTPAIRKSTGRHPAKKLSRHTPQHSKTLMRQAVKKPTARLKRRIKAQGHTDTLVAQPAGAIIPKLSFSNLDPKRLQHANHIKKSDSIKHFSQIEPTYVVPVTVTKSSGPALKPITPPKRQPAPEASDIFERAVQQATSHLEPAPKAHKKRRLHLGRKHARA